MRQITEQAVNAFLNGTSLNKQNMCVQHDSISSEMFLHGNKIAVKDNEGRIYVSWAGWPTRTTTDRLHALAIATDSGFRMNIVKGKPCINGRPVNPEAWTLIKEAE